MPEITDPRKLAVIQAQQQATLAGPVAAPPRMPGQMPLPPTSNRLPVQQANDAARLGIAQQGQVNEDTRTGLAIRSDAREETKAEREKREAAITGGVDPTESESTAAFLTTQLGGHVRKINQVMKDHPEAIQPGWLETIGGWAGPRARDIVTPNRVEDIRGVINNRYGLAVDVLLTLGTGAAYTEYQKKTYIESYSPQVTDGPERLKDKANLLKEAVIAAKTKSGVAAVQVEKALKQIDELYGLASGEVAPEKATAEVGSEVKHKNIPEGYQNASLEYINKHPPGTLNFEEYFALRQQLDTEYGGLQTDPEQLKKWVDDYNKGRGSKEIGPMEVPIEGIEKKNAETASSGLGTAAIALTNAATAGGVDLAVGAEGRAAKGAAAAEHPYAALAGEVAGSIAPTTMLTKAGAKGLAKLAPNLKPTTAQKLAGDMGVQGVYGAARGAAGAEEGEGLSDALKGVAFGAGGSAVAGTITRGVTPFLSARTQKGLTEMSGVKTTTLQKLGLGRLEEALQGVPFSHGARARSIKSYNVNNANRALSNIGKSVPKGINPGTELNAFVNKELNAAYNTIRPKIVGSADGQFDNGLVALHANAATTPAKKEMWSEINDALKMFKDENGHYTGQGYKEASERLRYLAKSWATRMETQGDVPAGDMARVAEQARRQMQFLIQRQTPEVGAELKKIERGWAHSVRIEDATGRALATGDGVYSPSQHISSIKKFDHSARKGASARGKALDQPYAESAARVLGPSGIPKLSSGQTATILGSAGLLGYTGAGIVPAIVSAAAIGAYGPGVKRIVQLVLSGKRPSAADNDILRRALTDAIRHESTGDK